MLLQKFLGKLRGKSVSIHTASGRGSSGSPVGMEGLEDRRLLASTASGLDPANMGKGDWIVSLSAAAANLGADTFEEIAQGMASAGVKWVVIKAGDGNDGPLFNYGDGVGNPPEGSWGLQFNRSVIEAFHDVGIKVLGYQFIYGGGDVTGTSTLSTVGLEEKVAKDILSLGPDGLVVSAEGQLENVSNRALVTENYMKSIRTAFPEAFIGYAPFAYVSDHPNFPYEQFSKYANAAMPKAYYITLPKANNSPEKMVADLNSNWTTLYNNFRTAGKGTLTLPIVPIGQGRNEGTERVTESRMNRWFDQLRFDQSGTSPGGYNGTSFFSVQDHTPEMWRGIRTNALGAPGGIVDGRVFQDNNGDGIQSAGDPNLLGWTVYSDANNNGVLDSGEVRTTTAFDGTYRLFWLPAGTHTIRLQLPDHLWRLTTPGSQAIVVADDQTHQASSFGTTQNPQFAGTVYNDQNADGTRQANEPGLRRATVWADFDNDGRLDAGEPRVVTGRNGRYAITVPVGGYIVRMSPPAGFRGVAPNRGFHRVAVFGRGTTVDGKNFGATSLILIKGTVFNDVNRNAIFDSGDTAGAPTTIWADLNGNGLYDALTEPTAAVGSDGVYRFTTLSAGTYQIRAETPGGWVRTRPAGSLYVITLGNGGSTSKKDFGQFFAG